MDPKYSLSSYHYDLDESFIAQEPATPPDSSKLLVRGHDKSYSDCIFSELPSLIDDDRVFFFNNSKVIKSRLVLTDARLIKLNGQEKRFDGEIFFLEEVSTTPLTRGDKGGLFKCMVYPGDYFPVGSQVEFEWNIFRVKEIVYEGRILELENGDIWSILEDSGQMPLPPYIEYDKKKESGYQTIFAEKQWSLAAPTASLHFTPSVIENLKKNGIERKYITLHVGLGTFKNIHEEDIRNYEMHAERIEIPTSIFYEIARIKRNNMLVLAVGTTVTRTLESLPYLWNKLPDKTIFDTETLTYWGSISEWKESDWIISNITVSSDGKICFSSKVFIYGDFQWSIVDEMITNFHLPSSTLFMLVSSFIGLEETKRLYEYAKEKQYRFFSFGDAMYLKGR